MDFTKVKARFIFVLFKLTKIVNRGLRQQINKELNPGKNYAFPKLEKYQTNKLNDVIYCLAC